MKTDLLTVVVHTSVFEEFETLCKNLGVAFTKYGWPADNYPGNILINMEGDDLHLLSISLDDNKCFYRYLEGFYCFAGNGVKI